MKKENKKKSVEKEQKKTTKTKLRAPIEVVHKKVEVSSGLSIITTDNLERKTKKEKEKQKLKAKE